MKFTTKIAAPEIREYQATEAKKKKNPDYGGNLHSQSSSPSLFERGSCQGYKRMVN